MEYTPEASEIDINEQVNFVNKCKSDHSKNNSMLWISNYSSISFWPKVNMSLLKVALLLVCPLSNLSFTHIAGPSL